LEGLEATAFTAVADGKVDAELLKTFELVEGRGSVMVRTVLVFTDVVEVVESLSIVDGVVVEERTALAFSACQP
jgi:hypothetical protein